MWVHDVLIQAHFQSHRYGSKMCGDQKAVPAAVGSMAVLGTRDVSPTKMESNTLSFKLSNETYFKQRDIKVK